jgi:hypothetical protein
LNMGEDIAKESNFILVTLTRHHSPILMHWLISPVETAAAMFIPTLVGIVMAARG